MFNEYRLQYSANMNNTYLTLATNVAHLSPYLQSRTLTHVPLPPQTRSLTHLRLMTVSAPKTLTILIQLSKYVDDIKMKDKCNKIMPLGSEINWQDVFFDMSFIYLKMYTLNYFTFIFFI